ncbi:MAG: hypothetical protein EPO21_24725 [Chloroflexota bacterium]|nr:MAG: hypothetical protein EPO21_24725 [Chloroflexota bacterium]
MAQRSQIRRDPSYNYDEILIGYDSDGMPIYAPGPGATEYEGGDQTSGQYDTAPQYDSGAATGVGATGSTLAQINEAIRANRALREQAQKGGWYKLDPTDPDGEWYQDPNAIKAVADLDQKYANLLGQRRQAETAAKEKPGAGTFIRGNTMYKYGEDGTPVPVYTFPSTATSGGGTASSIISQWTTKTAPDGSMWRVNEATGQKEQIFAPKAKMPWEDDFTKGNKLYRYDESGMPQPVYTFPQDEEALWQQALERQKFKQQEQRDRTQNTINMFQNLQQGQIQAAPYALRPGQQWHGGYEPGGVMQSIARMDGRYYDPDNYRVSVVQYDPEAQWRAAQENLRRILEEYDNQPDEEAPYGQTHLRR